MPTNEDYYEDRYPSTESDAFMVAGPRRCPHHGEIISSDDGMFDGVCNTCEGIMSEETEKWEHNPENHYRKNCGYNLWGKALGTQRVWLLTHPTWKSVACVPTPEDEIPF
jgi:hypothetical protein